MKFSLTLKGRGENLSPSRITEVSLNRCFSVCFSNMAVICLQVQGSAEHQCMDFFFPLLFVLQVCKPSCAIRPYLGCHTGVVWNHKLAWQLVNSYCSPCRSVTPHSFVSVGILPVEISLQQMCIKTDIIRPHMACDSAELGVYKNSWEL